MNKDLLFPCIFSFCLLFAFVFVANASFLEVTEDIAIEGNGTFERDFEAHSSPGHTTGQKLFETVLPVYSIYGDCTASYQSNFELIVSNNSTIYYESSSSLSHSKHRVDSMNYELGTYTGIYYIGAQNKSFLFESSPSLSEAIVKSEVEGRSVVHARVVNVSAYHIRTLDSRTWLEGNHILDWAILVRDIEYPEAGEEDDDWLACP